MSKKVSSSLQSSKKHSTKARKSQETESGNPTPFEILCSEPERINPAILLAEELMRKGIADVLDFADLERAEETLKIRKQMCEELVFEIEKITFEPEKVVVKHGKLKSWLSAILSVQICLIYCEETDRHNAEQDEIKCLNRLNQAKKKSLPTKQKNDDNWQSDLAKSVFQKAVGKSNEDLSDQPSLF